MLIWYTYIQMPSRYICLGMSCKYPKLTVLKLSSQSFKKLYSLPIFLISGNISPTNPVIQVISIVVCLNTFPYHTVAKLGQCCLINIFWIDPFLPFPSTPFYYFLYGLLKLVFRQPVWILSILISILLPKWFFQI